jgi:hypothetical protein
VEKTVAQIIITKEFRDFYKSATDYCDHIENYHGSSSADFMKATRQNLLHLYDTGLKLQWVDLQSNAEFDDRLDDKEFETILHSISAKLGQRYYWHVFNPSNQEDTESVCGDLVDDLGDIYKDLKRSILLYQIDTIDSRERAVWDFKFLFEKHWNDHCINALTGIHFFLQHD